MHEPVSTIYTNIILISTALLAFHKYLRVTYVPVAISKAMQAADQMSAGGPYPLPTNTFSTKSIEYQVAAREDVDTSIFDLICKKNGGRT